ncbi:MAG: cell division protein ZapE [Alteromonadaceae bacterium]|nr:MAG: cell division protein ZapE [Alteromonadaceae bacterium]
MYNTPLGRYQHDIERSGFQVDASQQNAVEHLQRLFYELVAQNDDVKQAGFFQRLKKRINKFSASPPPIKGLYFWGGVGRGKTYLMDLFFDALPIERKIRTHFHRFMRRVHAELRELENREDPLDLVAELLAAEAKVICFDEFFVSDIGDAMILANLFRGLFERGVVLVATSNIEPDNLYRNGLQRLRFIPVIKMLNELTEVVNVDGGTDYRLRQLQKASLYHSPLGEASEQALGACFDTLIVEHGLVRNDVEIEVEGRLIPAVRESEGIVWFTFGELCGGPRSQNDYIQLASEYHTLILQDVPVLGVEIDDQVKRFIHLVDEFYDRNVKLAISAAADLAVLYTGGRLEFEFQRTQSRLQEMQSQVYLTLPHKP